MEIHKLTDESPKNSNCDDKSSQKDETVLKITAIKQGLKNPNRVNVFVNGDFAFSLSIAQVVDLGIRKGRVITADELAEYRQASEFGKLYQRTLEWVLVRPRAIRETKDYLFEKLRKSSENNSAVSQTIIERLCDKGYLNDAEFARWYVENRFAKKGVSRKRLRMELVKKGVAVDIINEVLDGRNDEEEIRKMIARKSAKYDDSQKLIAYLCRQGFSYDLVCELVRGDEGLNAT